MRSFAMFLLVAVALFACDEGDKCAVVSVGDCDQHVDYALYYPDVDRDGYGDEAAAACLCEAGKNHPLTQGGDCDDGDRRVNPEMAEKCNRIDDDCDGATDEDFAGLGEPCDGPDSDRCPNGTRICSADGEDSTCSPEDPSNLVEFCNGVDDDCDGETDEDFGIGEACDGPDEDQCANGLWVCTADEMGSICGAEDQEDIQETCNGVDDDCDGQTDEGFGTGEACDGPDEDQCANGLVICTADELGTICGTEDPEDIEEICNGVDDDCDGQTDEDFGDTDEDGVASCVDNCPIDVNPDQADADENGVGDVCEGLSDDADMDGVDDESDNCVHVPNFEQQDGDEDGVGDACDNCPEDANSDQADVDRVEVTFDHAPFSPAEDCVEPDLVCLWRDETGPVVNTADGTMEWACGDCTAPASDFFPSHSDLKSECFADYLPDTVGQTTCLHVVETDAYWNVTWTSFQSGGGGGFGYVRVGFNGGDACDGARGEPAP
ncbi:MAG: putative metal-binding motif-containing protein [Deltaproteobacteria bacterium]|nr:putative metal-binding motif-containing protein [Deltaproteobacteria bacterium]